VRRRRLLLQLQCSCVGADPGRTLWIHGLLVACQITNSLEAVAMK
jgi:hypothetical protein